MGNKLQEYLNYYKHDIRTTKEVAESMNKNEIRKNPTPNIYAVINGKMYAPESIAMRHDYRQSAEYEFCVTVDPFHALDNPMLTIENVIFNPPATIVFWSDGSKTVVKRQGSEEFDPEKGLTMAFFKKMYGDRGRYFDKIKKWTEKYEEERPKIKPIDWAAIATALRKTGVDPLSIEGFNQLLKNDDSDSNRPRVYSHNDVIFNTRGEVEEVLDKLNEIIINYGYASVKDFYDMVGETANYIDNCYGWNDLTLARSIHTQEGHLLRLPKAVDVDQFRSKGE